MSDWEKEFEEEIDLEAELEAELEDEVDDLDLEAELAELDEDFDDAELLGDAAADAVLDDVVDEADDWMNLEDEDANETAAAGKKLQGDDSEEEDEQKTSTRLQTRRDRARLHAAAQAASQVRRCELRRLAELGRKSQTRKELRALREQSESPAEFIAALYRCFNAEYNEVGQDKMSPLLVDLDSLVYDVCDALTLDWQHGGQTLAFVGALERHVLRMTQGGRSVRVVALDSGISSWQGCHAAKKVARVLAQRHLTQVSAKHSQLDVVVFESVQCDEFRQFLRRNPVADVLVGEHTAEQRQLALFLASHGQNVARSTEVDFPGTALMTHRLVLPGVLCRVLREELQALRFESEVIEGAAQDEPDDWSLGQPVAAQAVDASLLQEAAAVGGKDAALTLLVYAAKQVLRHDASEEAVDAMRVLVAQRVLSQSLSVRQRAFAPTPLCDPEEAAVQRLRALVQQAMEHVAAALPSVCDECDEVPVDVLDGRLMHLVAAAVASEVTLGHEVSTRLTQVLAHVLPAQSQGQSQEVQSQEVLSATSALRGVAWRLPGQEHSEALAVAPVSGKLADATVRQVDTSLRKLELVSDSAAEVPQARQWAVLRSEGWQPGAQVDDGIRPQDLQSDARARRMQQTQNNFYKRYAQSLQGGKLCLRDVIVSATKDTDKNKQQSGDHKKKKGGGNKKKQRLKKGGVSGNMQEQVRRETEERKRLQQREDLHSFCAMCARMPHHERVAKLDEKLASIEDVIITLDAQFVLLGWVVEWYKRVRYAENQEPARRLFQLVFDIFRRYRLVLSVPHMHSLQHALKVVGFDDAARELAEQYVATQEALAQQEVKAAKAAQTAEKKKGKKAGKKGKASKASASSDAACGVSEEAAILAKVPELDQVLLKELPLEDRDTPPIEESMAVFQLKHVGDLMVRDVDSNKDARVEGFYPDKWQRDLLDVVDEQASALVVAPTSSGKTFVSYYAMKKVILENRKAGVRPQDRGLIVYVCPTKALVNQVEGDIYRRYGPVFGALTADYDHKFLECDVLVTVPESLEEVLLRQQRQDWTARLRYVIFDEVHCIGKPLSGAIWERCLQLMRCPFLALSATLGEPSVFHEWLRAIANCKRKGFKFAQEVRMIRHTERWSDLEKDMYLPRDPAKTPQDYFPKPQGDGTLQAPAEALTIGSVADEAWARSAPSQLTKVHPLAAFGLGGGVAKLKELGDFPPDVVFSSHDSLLVHQAMKVALRRADDSVAAQLAEQVDGLEPTRYFGARYIGKREARQYEQRLKATLVQWLHEHDALVQAVIDQVSASLDKHVRRVERAMTMVSAESTEEKTPYDKAYLRRHFLQLLAELDRQKRLPAVVFCLDPVMCEDLAKLALKDLEELEELKVASVDRTEQKARDKAAKKAEKEAKRQRDKKLKLDKKSDQAMLEDETAGAAVDENDEERRLLMRARDQTSLVRRGENMDPGELRYWMWRAVRKMGSAEHPLLRVLERGIGVHHEGMPQHYRSLVETMFRNKNLKVVLATGTLALGVNMPCRSTVFCGDWPGLTPLTFRQMMGRAGRRGYDNVGHVTFFGVPPAKVSYLMTAELLSLQGHAPSALTPVTALKMAQCASLTEKISKDLFKTYTKEAVSNLLQASLLSPRDVPSQLLLQQDAKAPHSDKALLFRYYLELLRRQGLLTNKLAPTGMAGLVTRLSRAFVEKGGDVAGPLVLAALFEDGVLHDIAADYTSGNAVALAGEVLRILSHVFHRVPLPASELLPSVSRDVMGSVVLPALSELSPRAEAVLKRYNEQVLELTTQFAVAGKRVADLQQRRGCTQLPLSQRVVSHESDEAADATALPCLKDTSVARSALSSNGLPTGDFSVDGFGSARQLLDALDTQAASAWLNRLNVPVLESVDVTQRALRLNAYVLDFWQHGRFTALQTENGLTDVRAWSLLKQWQLTLSAINTALKRLHGIDLSQDNADLEKLRAIRRKRLRFVRRGAVIAKTEEKQQKEADPTAAWPKIVRLFNFLDRAFTDKFRGTFTAAGGGTQDIVESAVGADESDSEDEAADSAAADQDEQQPPQSEASSVSQSSAGSSSGASGAAGGMTWRRLRK